MMLEGGGRELARLRERAGEGDEGEVTRPRAGLVRGGGGHRRCIARARYSSRPAERVGGWMQRRGRRGGERTTTGSAPLAHQPALGWVQQLPSPSLPDRLDSPTHELVSSARSPYRARPPLLHPPTLAPAPTPPQGARQYPRAALPPPTSRPGVSATPAHAVVVVAPRPIATPRLAPRSLHLQASRPPCSVTSSPTRPSASISTLCRPSRACCRTDC